MRAVLVVLAAVASAAAVAACGSGSKHVSSAPPARALTANGCSPVTYGGTGRPQFLIGAIEPLQGLLKDHAVQNAQALKLILAEHGWKAGSYRIGLQICDETTATSDYSSPERCAASARAFARNRSVLAIVGPTSSSCARAVIIALSKADDDAPVVVSPSATYLGLTRAGPGVARGEPASLYGGGPRTFVRVVPADDVQAAAAASYMKDHAIRKAYVLGDMSAYGQGLGDGFAFAAKKLGLAVGGSAGWSEDAKDYRHLVARVSRVSPDAVFIAGFAFGSAPQLISELRAALPDAQLIGTDGMAPNVIAEGAGDAAEGFLNTIAVVPTRALPAGGRAFADQFQRHYTQLPCCFSVNSAQAGDMVLDAIADSGASRAKVRRALFGARVKDGLVGDFAIDRFGDTTLMRIGVYRIRDGQNQFERSITPPVNLLARR